MVKLKNDISLALTLENTFLLKGIAICGMLCWHLFYCANPEGVEFSSFTRWIGMLGDVCVSLFLFVSGYGLAVSFEKSDKSIGKFVICRFVKFYTNYWFLLMLLLPVGIFVFNKPITSSTEILDVAKILVREIFAVSGHQAYNPSWWFNTLIIQLYMLFPLLYYGVKYACAPTVLIALLLRGALMKISKGVYFNGYIMIFILAIVIALHRKLLFQYFIKISKWIWVILAMILLLASILLLTYLDDGHTIYSKGLYAYMLLTIGIVMLVMFFTFPKYISLAFQFLGKHSMNIYLMHTLIFYYFFPKFFYSFDSPILIFISLLTICLILSVCIEKMKIVTRYNKLSLNICAKIR